MHCTLYINHYCWLHRTMLNAKPRPLWRTENNSACVFILTAINFIARLTFTGDPTSNLLVHSRCTDTKTNHYQLPGSQPMSCASFWALRVYSWGLNPLLNDDVLCQIRLWLFWRCKGYERTSLTTYNLIAGLQVCASSLGSMIAPPISGVITRTLGYPWNQTLLAFMAFIMVSSGTAIVHNRNK